MVHVRLDLSILLMLPLINMGLVLQNWQINSNLCFKDFSKGISCVINLIINTILPLGWFLCKQQKNQSFDWFLYINVRKVRTDSSMEQVMGIEPTSQPWQGRVLAVVLHLQIGGASRTWTGGRGVAVLCLTNLAMAPCKWIIS